MARAILDMPGPRDLSGDAVISLSKWRELSFEKKLSIVVVPVVLAVLSLIVPALIDLAKPAPTPRLKVADVVVRDGNLVPETAPQVEIIVRNVGDRLAVLTRATITIKASVLLQPCAGEGAIDISGRYDVVLPGEPRPGQQLEVPISHQVDPDGVDRFALRFALHPDVLSVGNESTSAFYQLGLTLIHDDAKRLEAPDVIVAVPTTPYKGWPSSDEDAFNSGANFSPTYVRCERDRKVRAAQFLSRTGKRSEQLVALTEAFAKHPPSPIPTTSGKPLVELGQLARAVASKTAPDSVDGQGNVVSYDAANVLDGNPETAWRVPGDGVGVTLTITFPQEVFVGAVGVTPGYAKVDPLTGEERFPQNGRPSRVAWRFGDGPNGVVEQSIEDMPNMQTRSANYRGTRTVVLTILASTPGTRKPASTAISDVRLLGFVR